MVWNEFLNTIVLMFILLNPFLVIIYIMDIVQDSNMQQYSRVIIRAGSVSFIVFVLFAILGETIFTVVFQSNFESFQIYGGIIFLIIGIRFIFSGNEAIQSLRGAPEHVAGALAMPIMIGPGTVSASIITGQKVPHIYAVAGIFIAVSLSCIILILLKKLHDIVRRRNEKIIERYIEVTGRITALIVGSFAIDMIVTGIKAWFNLN